MSGKGVLVVSLCFNLGLAGALAYFYKHPKPEGEASRPATATRAEVAPATAVKEAVAEELPTSPAPALPKFTWSEVEAADYKEYITKLRGIGCPEETIKDIILADVNKLYAPRFAALRGPQPEFKYWKRNYSNPPLDKEKAAQTKQLSDEKDALLRELLGADYKKEQSHQHWYQEQQDQLLSFLTKAQREQLTKVQASFDAERSEIYRKAQNYIDSDTQAELRAVYRKQLEAMGQFMTPEEVHEYALRTSDTSRNLRYQLSLFAPTEEEFREIYKAKTATEEFDNFSSEQARDKDFMKKRAEAQKQAEDALKEKLGEERLVEYKRAQDYSYTSLVSMGEYLGFDKAAANKVFDLKGTAEAQANKIRADRTLTPEQRTAALQAIRSAASAEITGLIGEKGYKAYRRQGGYWLSNISPNP